MMMMMMDNLNFPINQRTGAEMHGDKWHDILLLKICAAGVIWFVAIFFSCCFTLLMSLHG